jgi:thiol-disulfide isomerase/thioredoxin
MNTGIENSKGVVLINMTMDDCPKCKTLKPHIDNLKVKYHNMCEFHEIKLIEKGKMDPLAEKYYVMASPTVLIFKDGELKHQEVSPSESTLDKQIADLI